MIIGMLPMSLGLGEGGEQNAPLGRAVIGGLLVATFFTLFFVPVMYSLLRRQPPAAGPSPEPAFRTGESEPDGPDEPAVEGPRDVAGGAAVLPSHNGRRIVAPRADRPPQEDRS
jgi:hypothetical protein